MQSNNNNHINNLENKDAIKKIKHIAEGAGVCMFETFQPEPPLSVRPMSAVAIDDEAVFWFFSSRSSKKNKEIAADPHVQLLFSNQKDNEFLSVYGTAEIITDKFTMVKMWSPLVKAWFPEGINDPDLSLIKVTPESSYYWDTKHNKMTALIKIAISVFANETMDDGVEGTLTL
jgi:general stress protein 26